MLFCFVRQIELNDGSGMRKASILRSATNILPIVFASTLFVFLLFGQVNSDESYNGPIGFYNHTLKDGQVTLANYSIVVKEKGDNNLTKYTESKKSCDVEIKGNGNM